MRSSSIKCWQWNSRSIDANQTMSMLFYNRLVHIHRSYYSNLFSWIDLLNFLFSLSSFRPFFFFRLAPICLHWKTLFVYDWIRFHFWHISHSCKRIFWPQFFLLLQFLSSFSRKCKRIWLFENIGLNSDRIVQKKKNFLLTRLRKFDQRLIVQRGKLTHSFDACYSLSTAVYIYIFYTE